MHTATQLDLRMFAVSRREREVAAEAVFDGWKRSDRLGVVVTEAFGALGASLLIQLATAQFYRADAGRALETAQYPEIYLFHCGRRWGDHRPFDFWPPRKEVLVHGPLNLVEAINDRAISRLLLPTAEHPTWEYLTDAPTPWAERNSFLERVVTAIEYDAAGIVEDPAITVSALSTALEANGTRALNPEISLEWYRNLQPEARATALPGPSGGDETARWLESLLRRADEVDPDTRATVRRRRQRLVRQGLATESYRDIAGEDALRLISTYFSRTTESGAT